MSKMIEVFLFKTCLGAGEGAAPAEKRRIVSMAARNFVRVRIARLTGRSYDSLIFSAGAHGKPYIEGCEVQFNLSHCGNVILAAFSEDEIGADIEITGRSGNAMVQRAFTQGERDYIAVAPSEQAARRRFCEIWTAKEAFLKLHGVGLSGGLNFAAADGSGLFDEIVSREFGSAAIFRRRVNVELERGDFVPKIGEIVQPDEAEFQICLCANKIDKVSFQMIE